MVQNFRRKLIISDFILPVLLYARFIVISQTREFELFRTVLGPILGRQYFLEFLYSYLS